MYRKLLIAAIIFSGLGYLCALAGENMTMRWILKPGTIILMILLAATTRNVPKPYKNLIITGLFLSAIGDSFLLLAGKQWFLFGLVAFLFAHIAYVVAFVTRWRFSPVHLLVIIPIAAYSFLLLDRLHASILAGGNAGLWIPVLVYVVVISIMIWSAVISRSWIAIAGAILFFMSDSLLAWNMFVMPISWAGYGVMISYYLAQFLLASSIVRSKGSAIAYANHNSSI
ncbi:lysoplasmalogenase [Paenibacillus radicis (ex Xue et al. 2023)]|uniref:Lysoplasmalogenase n=1 Tax=Paenibacillus radicis (ex Xue et al. 2023) TaxID=2972489 RepID=A0ABT1YDY2_9BACL|nr:lysoplasmalogenase [Paenibacillus radicis (ex Xue et al. 2023)]MCR8630180.1 lysoplasmalogenase [Paenibacillus radicis (ex Xue et al. 2023)]